MTRRISPKLCFLLCALALAVGATLWLWLSPSAPSDEDRDRDRYFLAVYVLQQLDEPARRVQENIPARVRRFDATESLLHHPDKIFVLEYLADELAKTGKGEAKALYFEACARLALGERRRVADLLTRYVIQTEYNRLCYALLCETLHSLGDDLSLLLICREWRERDPERCPERCRYTWTALYNLARYDQALAFLRDEAACLGWEAQVFEAKTVLALQGESSARLILERALERDPAGAARIERLWNSIKEKYRV
jgi:tetratricopeptide (TPR) repeat protein